MRIFQKIDIFITFVKIFPAHLFIISKKIFYSQLKFVYSYSIIQEINEKKMIIFNHMILL